MAAVSAKRRRKEAILASVEYLREDPPRMKRLLREIAGLADDLAEVLTDAGRPDDAKQVRRAAKLARATALLPASLAALGIEAAVSKFM